MKIEVAQLLQCSCSDLLTNGGLTMNTSAYHELNLREGASEAEIKAAFRRMAKDYHPDTAQVSGDSDKFRRAYQAYRSLIKKFVSDRAQIAKFSSTPYVFEGQKSAGLDVYYDLALVRPKVNGSFTLVLPTTVYQACPRCLGQGKTLARRRLDSNLYRPQVCPKCQGTGSMGTSVQLKINVTPEMAARGKFRLPKVGKYEPKEAKRGDLIINLRWVDRLPFEN
jgi:DnaJ-class molecular chaperone